MSSRCQQAFLCVLNRENLLSAIRNCGSPLFVALPGADYGRRCNRELQPNREVQRKPDYLHSGMGSSFGVPQNSIPATTSSWGISLPASASRMPSSMATKCQVCRSTNSRSACSTSHDRGRSRVSATEVRRSSSSGSIGTFKVLVSDMDCAPHAARRPGSRGRFARRRRSGSSTRRNWRISFPVG